MDADQYFSIIFILQCSSSSEQRIKPQPFFPPNYLAEPDTDENLTKKVKNRRNKWYNDVREHYRLVQDEQGVIIGLEVKKSRLVVSNTINEEGECTVLYAIILFFYQSDVFLVDKEFKSKIDEWKLVIPSWQVQSKIVEEIHGKELGI